MTTEHFESIGADLCRTLLVYENIYIPPELESIYGKKEDGAPPMNISQMIANEIL
jgi:hypothetical protein